MKPVQLYRLIQETAPAKTAYDAQDNAGVVSALTSPVTPVETVDGTGATVTTADMDAVTTWEALAERLVGRYGATMTAINEGTITTWDAVLASINEQS
tara:strand:+ start:6100 stop:6393 length:294 start_codon:yes stop_codon:yes gene_type:complete